MGTWATNPDYDRACALFEQGDYARAEPLFRAAGGHQPRRPRVAANHALCLLNLDRAAHALPLVERALALDPTDPTLWRAASRVHLALGRAEEAQAAAERGLQQPGAAEWHEDLCFSLGEAAITRGLPRQGLDAARRMLGADPRGALGWFLAAVALVKLQRVGEARRAAALATALEPDDAVYRELVDDIDLAMVGLTAELPRARALATEGGTDGPVVLGDLLVRLGRLDEALAVYERAHEERETPPDAAHMLSRFEADCRLALLDPLPG